MSNDTPIVGLLTVELYVSDALTLKDKRSVVKGLLDRLGGRFNVAVAEVGALDNHRTAILALTTVANDSKHVERVLEACRSFIAGEPRAVLQDSSLELL
jgi:uncharacterized protein